MGTVANIGIRMTINPKKHNRRSIRLRGYDYTQPGGYFVTICAYQHKCVLGKIREGKMILSHFGEIVQTEWFKTSKIRPNVELFRDEFVIMPNHVHGIIWIVESVGAQYHCAPTSEEFGKPVPGSLPTIVRSFKSAVTRCVNKIREEPGSPFWQRNYYERVIRNDYELNTIREYIKNNPMKWDLDRENPKFNRASR